jgi:hypothetical protein
MKKRLLRIFRSFLLLSLIGAAQAAESNANDLPSLVITYQVAPASRPEFRRALETSGLRQFQQWKNEGILNSYRILFNRYSDSDNWDAMALLAFSSAADLEHWNTIEQTNPAGLTPQALALVKSIRTTPVSLARSKSATQVTTNSVFMVIPYITMVSVGDYLKYADSYMSPQFEGSIAESILSRYDLFVSIFPASRPWSSLVVLEYKDQESLNKRGSVEAKVRGRLKDVPEWKTFNDLKKSIREEKQIVIAEQISQR